MADNPKLFTVWLEEFDAHEIVLPGRTEREARTTAFYLRHFFGNAGFSRVPCLPNPDAPKPRPEIADPERLLSSLARLYRLFTERDPDRCSFPEQCEILERQIDYLRVQGFGKHNTALRGHDSLVAFRKLPGQIIPAGCVKREPANPVERASHLKKLQLTKVRNFVSRIAYSVQHPEPPDAPPILPGEEDMLRRHWRKLQRECAHARDIGDPLSRQPKRSQQTAFDRLTKNARQFPPPPPAREQNNGQERD